MFENLKSGDVVVDAHDAGLVYIGSVESRTGVEFVFMTTEAKVARFDSSGAARGKRANIHSDNVRDTTPMQTPAGVFEGAIEGYEYDTKEGNTVVFVGMKPAVDDSRTSHIVYDVSADKCVSYTARGEFYEDGTPSERDIEAQDTPQSEPTDIKAQDTSQSEPTATEDTAPPAASTVSKPKRGMPTGVLGAMLGSALGAALSQALDGDPADEYDIPLMAELIKEICRK